MTKGSPGNRSGKNHNPPNHIPLDFEQAIEGLLQVDPQEPEDADQPDEKKADEKRAKKK